MKTKIIAASLFAFTAAAVGLYPAYQTRGAVEPPPEAIPAQVLTSQQPLIEVVFVLDTTGSMAGLIQAAKEKIWSIASTMSAAQTAPVIRMGLVAYRDRGDDYVTRVVDLSEDLDSVYATLMDFHAGGGGDGPESVNQALFDAVHGVSWSRDPDAYKVIFLVGDAPPHMDYQDDVKYPATMEAAKARGIVVNAIQCGNHGGTAPRWKHIAQLGDGHFFRVDQAGGAVAIATPFDERLARLSAEIDRTRLYYGSDEKRAEKQRKLDASDKLHAAATPASRARRATFNASPSGAKNLIGDSELVDDVASGRVELEAIDRDQLPEPLQTMAPEEQKAVIAETAQRRQALQKEIRDLARQRADYLEEKVEEAGGAEESLDSRIYGAVREQAGKKGLRYGEDALAY